MTEHFAGNRMPGLVPRPPFQLRSLPIEFRWEVTRRHPYYQAWWILAKRHYDSAPLESEYEPALRQFWRCWCWVRLALLDLSWIRRRNSMSLQPTS